MKSGELINLMALTGSHGNFKCVICYLQQLGLDKLIDGTEVLADNVNAQTQKFQRKSQGCVFSTNVLAISTPHLYLVTSCKQPKDVWDALKPL